MADDKQSSVPFLDARTQRRVDALTQASVTCSSRRLMWKDVLVETGRNGPWEASGLVVRDHYMCFNRKRQPIVIETQTPFGFRRASLPPGGFWVCSAGESFTHHVSAPASYGIITFAPTLLASTVGADRIELVRSYGIEDPRLRGLFEVLVREARSGGGNGPTFVDGVVMAMAAVIARRLASTFPLSHSPGRRLEREALRPVLELVEARLANAPTQAEMAVCLGLSPYYFAREFKRLTGESPHKYIVRRRLERAQERIRAGAESLAVVALKVGFADQSHLSRLFKRHFGLTPSAYSRQARR